MEAPSHTSEHLNGRSTYLLLILLCAWVLRLPVLAQAHRMPAAADGLFETGVPNYLIRSQDAIGLSSPPSDFHRLPDGRLLIYARQEIALGDGVQLWPQILRDIERGRLQPRYTAGYERPFTLDPAPARAAAERERDRPGGCGTG